MAIWRLFAFDQRVPCSMCRRDLGPAKDGMVVGFGDGNGNREMKCQGCGWKNIFDCTRSQEEAEAHMTRHKELLEGSRNQTIIAFALQRASWAIKIATAEGLMAKSVGGNPRKSAKTFDLPDEPPSEAVSAFDLGALISEEAGHVRRAVS
jgi:hypothetical protein